jgi:hypothetical protein
MFMSLLNAKALAGYETSNNNTDEIRREANHGVTFRIRPMKVSLERPLQRMSAHGYRDFRLLTAQVTAARDFCAFRVAVMVTPALRITKRVFLPSSRTNDSTFSPFIRLPY